MRSAMMGLLLAALLAPTGCGSPPSKRAGGETRPEARRPARVQSSEREADASATRPRAVRRHLASDPRTASLADEVDLARALRAALEDRLMELTLIRDAVARLQRSAKRNVKDLLAQREILREKLGELEKRRQQLGDKETDAQIRIRKEVARRGFAELARTQEEIDRALGEKLEKAAELESLCEVLESALERLGGQ